MSVLEMDGIQTGGGVQPSPILRSEIVAAFKRSVEALHGPAFTMAEACVLDPSAAPRSGCFNNANTLVEEAAEIETTTCTGSLFISVNPTAYRTGMGRGRITRASRMKDSDVTRLRNWFVDFDPERDTDTAATDAEKQCAHIQMKAARAHFEGLGFGAPIVADSGNGYHLHFLVDLPNDDRSRQLLKNATAQASALFSSAEVKLDVSVANPGRLTRLYGSVNRKGVPTPERPWRRTALLDVPAERTPLTVDQLTSFIQSGTTSSAESTLPPQAHDSPEGQAMAWRGDAGLRFDMPAFLTAASLKAKGPEDYNGGQRYVLDACPFNPDHNRGEAAVFVDELGAPGFNCFHDHCSENRGWAAFEKAVKAQLKDDAAALATIATLEQRTGYNIRPDGLFRVLKGGKERVRLGSPLEVIARVRDAESSNWGYALKFTAPDGKAKELVVSSAEMVNDSRAVLGRLAEAGYDLEHKPNVKDMLIGFIAGAKVPVQTRVDRPGWHSEAVYVLPDTVIQPRGGAVERLHFAGTSSGVAEYGVAGSLQEWQENIARLCVGNSRLALSVCAGFAGPLLNPTSNEVGGLHLCGTSSIGKSSALAVAGSVCGGGGGGYVRQWRATANGLEGVAEGHNDGLLVLDELQQVSPRDAAPAVYMLANGKGKSRASKEGNAVSAKSWRLMVLSSGELTLAAHTNDGGGAKVKAGAELRLLNIPADAGRGMGLFEEIHGFSSPAAFSDHVKSATKMFYGTPLRAFLRWFVENRDYALGRVTELQAGFGEAYIPAAASGEITRAAARFSLLCAAGELATEAGVTGWLPAQAARAAGTCFKAWLDERGSVVGGDVEAGVRQALAFVEEQGARFQRFDQIFVPRDRVGFVKTEGGCVQYMFMRGAFESIVCKGYNFRAVRDEMIRRKYMIAGEAEHPGQRKVTLPGLGRLRVFVLQIPEDAFDALPLAA